jgi:hypothetical protein
MGSKIVFIHYFLPTKISLYHYRENNFKLLMQKPFDVNPFTKLWKTFSLSQILVEKIFKYIKSVKLVVGKMISSMED